MGKFKVGQKVIVKEDYDDAKIKGLTGTIVCDDKYDYGVDFGIRFKDTDGNTAGHDLSGRIKTKTGWWTPEELLEPVKKNNYLRFLK